MTKTIVKWRKSSYSGGDHGQCVEVADMGSAVGIRDSKAAASGHLVFAPASFASLVERVKRTQ
ncbi:DUF397 domain-containing protein [Actinomadura logoneensis]|uniref:DUF397 domain-containing protein n=1 Tax=Actinomadura logoneensis TaxID=2293572 RepID=A0A372JKD3_9ACTN|nr:DUF397 domain-containing protein [Actinomadura logoneensis]RFU40493.1 DUF397 domain-containing protein [Actinomadura logoneensis]